MSGRQALIRMGVPEVSDRWLQQEEAGSPFIAWLIAKIALYFGRRASHFFLWPAACYFVLRRRSEREASQDFFRHLTGKRGSWWQAMRHLHQFSVVQLDRVHLLAG